MNKFAIVFHKIDFDGICSYAVIRSAIELNMSIAGQKYSITPIPWNRGDEIPDLKGYDTVFVADICLPVYVMKTLAVSTHLVWIDHHFTSIAEMEKEGLSDLDGLTGTGEGACKLSWRQMFPGTVCPKEVELLSAYDVWDREMFDWESETLPFQYGMRNRYGLDPDKFFNDFGRNVIKKEIDNIIEEGKVIIRYIRNSGRIGARNYGFDITFAGALKGLAILTDQGGSVPYEESAIERGANVIVQLNRIGDGKYKISCYDPVGCGFNIGYYLKKMYSGGGHESAGGAIISEEDFINIIQNKKI